MRQYIYIIIQRLIPALVLASLLLPSCSSPGPYRTLQGAIWGTVYHISYRSPNDLADSVRAVFARVEMSLSPFAPASLISRINRGDSAACADSLLHRVFSASRRVSSHSGGAFDPTVAPLVNLWGFGYRDTGIEPSQRAIDSLLATVGILGCSILPDGTIRKIHPDTEFNFSAITKGYGCDLVADMLRRNGVEDYMVEIGGEIALGGLNPKGEKWHIMIDAPIECDTAVVHSRMALIEISDCGVATSGNYRNYRTTPQGRVWHTISPVTGRPAVTDLLSATIIAPDAMTADAYATACMALPSDSALAMISALDSVEALLVRITLPDSSMTTVRTPGFPG